VSLPWDDPNADPLADIRAFKEWYKAHPWGHFEIVLNERQQALLDSLNKEQGESKK